MWDDFGFVVGTDSTDTLANELSEMLKLAKENDILVTLCLWNGAVASKVQK